MKSGFGRLHEVIIFGRGFDWENFGVSLIGNWLLTRVGHTWRFDCMNLPPPDLLAA